MTHKEEHIRDSEFADTWQAADADQFRKDEAAAAIAEFEAGGEYGPVDYSKLQKVSSEVSDSLF